MKLMENQLTAILTVYAEYFQAADQIVSDPELASEFLERVNKHLPESEQFSQVELNKTMLNLRKKGEEKGGLPRKQRSYAGRIVK